MGYTHYLYYTPKKITDDQWNKFTTKLLDCIKTARERGIDIEYTSDVDYFSFNGSDTQTKNKWTADGAGHLQRPSDDAILTVDHISKQVGEWFAGTIVDFPVCGLTQDGKHGRGSYESMAFNRKQERVQSFIDGSERGMYFECCKTNFHPYDVLVTASLLLFKEICPQAVEKISSDGETKDWVLGYILLKEATGIKAQQPQFH